MIMKTGDFSVKLLKDTTALILIIFTFTDFLGKIKKYIQGPVQVLCSSAGPQRGSVQSLVCVPWTLHAALHAPQS